MTDKIQHIIDGIRLKCKTLYYQLVAERALRLEHEAELTSIKSEFSVLKIENNEIQLENSKLKTELETIIQQRIDENQAGLKDRNEEIDDLVREIEHCINQLK